MLYHISALVCHRKHADHLKRTKRNSRAGTSDQQLLIFVRGSTKGGSKTTTSQAPAAKCFSVMNSIAFCDNDAEGEDTHQGEYLTSDL